MDDSEYFDSWRRYLEAGNWADYHAAEIFHAFIKASENGGRDQVQKIRSELEALRDALRKVVPRVERVDGIERTSDFKSPEELSYTDPEIERHMKWAAHWLHRTIDILNMDFTDPKPCPPPMVEEARQYLEDWCHKTGSSELKDPIDLPANKRNTSLWHAASLKSAIKDLDKAFGLVGQPGPYRVGKRDVLLNMAEAADAAVRIGRHYEILRRKWLEPLAVAEQKQAAARKRGSATLVDKHRPERSKIIACFEKLIAKGHTRADAVTQIAGSQQSVFDGKDLETEKKRVREILRRYHPDAWKRAKKHTP